MTKDGFSSRLASLRSRRVDEGDQEGWLVAYADLITLLFIFFSLLLSVSVISRSKFEWMSKQFNESSSANLAEIEKRIEQQVKQAGLQDKVSVQLGDEGLHIRFSETLLFSVGESDLNPSGLHALDGFSAVLKSIPPDYRIAVEGHTDDRPIQTAKYASNWSLSAARAVTVLHYLEHHGFRRDRLMVRAYADTRPVAGAPNADSEVLRAKNRRVALLVY